jgi:16S rRNA (adenine1518-N6/adenine1519-N6)-dimethyltransferase
MLEILQDRFGSNENITILHNDVLKINIDEEIEKIEKAKNIQFNKIKVVANLPYYITSPIIFKLLEDSTKVSEIVVMVQEEVADRIIAKSKSKDYGILTLMIQYYASATKQIIVPGSSFIPSPNVTSAIIKIIKEDKYNDIDAKIFKELVHKSFANRRKKVINSLVINKLLDLEKEAIDTILKKCNISENARAEELDIDKYIEVTKQLM